MADGRESKYVLQCVVVGPCLYGETLIASIMFN